MQKVKRLGQQGQPVAENGRAAGPQAAELLCRITRNKEHGELLIFKVAQ